MNGTIVTLEAMNNTKKDMDVYEDGSTGRQK